MSMEQEDTERSHLEPVFRYFKKNKVKISTAIKRPFPFFEFLRDNELITNKMYDDFQDSYSNLVPLQKVVYRALEELEKRLDLVVLGVLFSEENRKAYPDLELILESIENGHFLPPQQLYILQNRLRSQRSDRGDPNPQLSLEQGPDDNSFQQSLTWSPSEPSSSDGQRIKERRNATIIQGNQTDNHQSPSLQIHNVVSLHENGLSEDLYETVQSNQVRRDTASDNTDELERGQANILQGPDSEPEEPCELEVHLSASDPCLEPHSPLPRNEERAEQQSQGSQMHPYSMHPVYRKQNNSSFVLDDEETQARTSYNQASEILDLSGEDSDVGSNCWEESASDISQSSPRIPRQYSVDFSSPELPVTCGTAKGILYKEKFEQGTREKSIWSETGEWCTLREFEIKGDLAKSKKWKQSIRCNGRTLKELIENGYLADLPGKRRKNRKFDNCGVTVGSQLEKTFERTLSINNTSEHQPSSHHHIVLLT